MNYLNLLLFSVLTIFQTKILRCAATIGCYTCDPNYGEGENRGCPATGCDICGTEFGFQGFSDVSGSNIKRTCEKYPKTNFTNEAQLYHDNDFCQKSANLLSDSKCICHRPFCNSLMTPQVFVNYSPRLYNCFQTDLLGDCMAVNEKTCSGHYCVFAHQYEVQQQWRNNRLVYHAERHCARSCLNISSSTQSLQEGCVYVNRGQYALCYCRGDFSNIDSANQFKLCGMLLMVTISITIKRLF